MDHARGLVFHRPQAASHRRAVVYFCSAVLTPGAVAGIAHTRPPSSRRPSTHSPIRPLLQRSSSTSISSDSSRASASARLSYPTIPFPRPWTGTKLHRYRPADHWTLVVRSSSSQSAFAQPTLEPEPRFRFRESDLTGCRAYHTPQRSARVWLLKRGSTGWIAGPASSLSPEPARVHSWTEVHSQPTTTYDSKEPHDEPGIAGASWGGSIHQTVRRLLACC